MKSVEDNVMYMNHLVEAGASMAMVADLWELVGPPGDDPKNVSGTGMMQRIIHPVLSSMLNPSTPAPDASLSALERA